jgi:hypothetical protein
VVGTYDVAASSLSNQQVAALGLKIPFKDDADTAAFGDLAVNRVLRKGFLGAGLSWFDIGKDSGGLGVLLQGGVDLDKDGKWQFTVKARAPFSAGRRGPDLRRAGREREIIGGL